MHLPLLTDFVFILGLSILILILGNALRLPSIIGFLITGMIAGPKGLGIITSTHEIEQVAEIGIMFLLFTIGIEFSLNLFFQLKKTVLLGGLFQVLGTILVTAGIAVFLNLPTPQAIFLGFLLSLSSTAIVMKCFQERAEVDSPHGRIGMSILIFQDIVIVFMMIFTPILSGQEQIHLLSLVALFGKGALIIAVVLGLAHTVIPRLLHAVTRTRSRELFLITIVTLCMGITWLTSEMGLSASLGAFLAGLIISESIYSQQALGGVLPLKDVFSSFFFISIGMLFDYHLIWHNPVLVLAGATLVLFLKASITSVGVLLLRYPLRTALLVGIAISQIGEFSFVLSKMGIEYGLLNDAQYQLFIAISVLTMAITPGLIQRSSQLAEGMNRLPLPGWLKSGKDLLPSATQSHLHNHLIIVGFGTNGRNLSRAARAANIPYTILEMNSVTVLREQQRGEPINYGDASYEEVLHEAGIHEARILVVAISDPNATRRTIALARYLNPTLHIIARTRFVSEIIPLQSIGADAVIPEEFETSIRIFTDVLQKYEVPPPDIEALVDTIREEGYSLFQRAAQQQEPIQ
ncbi:MAG: cation:proton antiporter [bacterium]|jgi:CPA2 family monovalent cation:H+ antiporter-2|nr:cation:proton antiporter [bacterium]